MTKVFVYGTLKEGYHNHYLLVNSEKVMETVTTEKYAMYDAGGFPYVTKDEELAPVLGEVYNVDAETLADLDTLEGVRYNHYYREKIYVQGVEEPVNIYLACEDVSYLPMIDYIEGVFNYG